VDEGCVPLLLLLEEYLGQLNIHKMLMPFMTILLKYEVQVCMLPLLDAMIDHFLDPSVLFSLIHLVMSLALQFLLELENRLCVTSLPLRLHFGDDNVVPMGFYFLSTDIQSFFYISFKSELFLI
jgi:hypothetical protein